MTDYSRFYLEPTIDRIELNCEDHPSHVAATLGFLPQLPEVLSAADEHWMRHHAPDPTGMTCGMRCVEGHTYVRGDCALAGGSAR